METGSAVDALHALAQPTRLETFRLLVARAPTGASAGEIAAALDVPPATLSFHLAALSRAGLVERRAAGRERIYRARLGAMHALVDYLSDNCCTAAGCAPAAERRHPHGASAMTEADTWNVLFVCTGNSARSILAESLLRHYGGERFRAFSAGSEPAGAVQPLALQLVRNAGLPEEGLHSKSIDEFLGPDAPRIDIVITVCDHAAEHCPAFPGRPTTAHWGTADPAAAGGTEEERMQAFRNARTEIESRVKLLVNLPLASLDRIAREQRLRAIGREPGAA